MLNTRGVLSHFKPSNDKAIKIKLKHKRVLAHSTRTDCRMCSGSGRAGPVVCMIVGGALDERAIFKVSLHGVVKHLANKASSVTVDDGGAGFTFRNPPHFMPFDEDSSDLHAASPTLNQPRCHAPPLP